MGEENQITEEMVDEVLARVEARLGKEDADILRRHIENLSGAIDYLWGKEDE